MAKKSALTAAQQSAILADMYSSRARLYDSLWSPVIRPIGERLLTLLPLNEAREVIDIGTGAGALLPAIRRAAPKANLMGVDRSAGMLRLAKKRHAGPLALMDAQKLELPARRFDVAVVAFVLFHLPRPDRCLREVHRVLKPSGTVGVITWAAQHRPKASAVWEEEVVAAGARVIELPAIENQRCCDSEAKVKALLEAAGFADIRTWTRALVHHWRPEDHFEYQQHYAWLEEIQALPRRARDHCLSRVRARLARASESAYVYRGTVVMATANRPA
jgi:ubiquinone/menaquinone biosynthesis C-methylase UbiE